MCACAWVVGVLFTPVDHCHAPTLLPVSMTADELDCVKKIDDSRARRIAKGSGVMFEEVDMMLKMHKQYGKMFSSFGKAGLMKGSDSSMMQQMSRNPNAVLQQLQRGMGGMDPRMVSQLGGAGALCCSGCGGGGGGGGGPSWAVSRAVSECELLAVAGQS